MYFIPTPVQSATQSLDHGVTSQRTNKQSPACFPTSLSVGYFVTIILALLCTPLEAQRAEALPIGNAGVH